jgi:hypothetical protein
LRAADVVLNLAARRNLEARICSLFRSFITDWCGYELAVSLTAEASGRPPSFVRAVLEKHHA